MVWTFLGHSCVQYFSVRVWQLRAWARLNHYHKVKNKSCYCIPKGVDYFTTLEVKEFILRLLLISLTLSVRLLKRRDSNFSYICGTQNIVYILKG